MKLNNLTVDQLRTLYWRVGDKYTKSDLFSEKGKRLGNIVDKISLIWNRRYYDR